MSRPFTTADIPSQTGRLALVTGTTLNGLGYETALPLARAGVEVILASRNAEKNARALAALKAAVPGAKARVEVLDLSSLASVHTLAERLLAEGRPLDLLVLNAAVMQLPTRQTTEDGFEAQFGTNFLGHFALTGLLMPLLKAGRQTRVVSVASLAHRGAKIHFDDPQMTQNYGPWRAYQQSKLAMLILSIELERRSAANGWGITAIAAHPGWATTELIANGPGADSLQARGARFFARWFAHSPAAGALPTLFAATAPDARPGGYYGPDGFLEIKGDVSPAKIDKAALDPAAGARLWEMAEKLTGVRFS